MLKPTKLSEIQFNAFDKSVKTLQTTKFCLSFLKFLQKIWYEVKYYYFLFKQVKHLKKYLLTLDTNWSITSPRMVNGQKVDIWFFFCFPLPRWEKIILMVLVFKALARGDRRLLAGDYPKVDWIGSFPITFLDFIFWSRAYHQSLKWLFFKKEKDLVIFQNWILIFLIPEWFLK